MCLGQLTPQGPSMDHPRGGQLQMEKLQTNKISRLGQEHSQLAFRYYQHTTWPNESPVPLNQILFQLSSLAATLPPSYPPIYYQLPASRLSLTASVLVALAPPPHHCPLPLAE